MKVHRNAGLTPRQRQQVQALSLTGQHSKASLAKRFGVSRQTIAKWAARSETSDRSSAPLTKPKAITPAFEAAVVAYRNNEATSHHGKVRIAHELGDEHACSNPSNVYAVLKRRHVNKPRPAAQRQDRAIPVGRHRTQMDIQHLPAVEGGQGFDGAARAVQDFYDPFVDQGKVFRDSRRLHQQDRGGGFPEGFGQPPPLFITFTDNAMYFTMKYAHKSQYQTAFTKAVVGGGRIHALIPKGKPWKNGFIERSNRTDNENLFHKLRFVDSEERKYQLRLWEMEYNCHRPHQGIGNLTPIEKARQQHPIWTKYALSIT